jgi:hypothetical protein
MFGGMALFKVLGEGSMVAVGLTGTFWSPRFSDKIVGFMYVSEEASVSSLSLIDEEAWFVRIIRPEMGS